MAASKLFLAEIEACIVNNTNFAVETTLSGRSYLKLINRLKQKGWEVKLIYLALPNVEMSKMRVAERVKHGGHAIPNKAIERRFPRSLQNLLTEFSEKVDDCLCFMNDADSPVLVFEQQAKNRKIVHESYYQLIKGYTL